MQIYDNVLTSNEIREIQSHLLSSEFPWYYARNVTHPRNPTFSPAFYHYFEQKNEYADLICKRIGMASPRYSRACLQLPNGTCSDAIEGLHIDTYERGYEPHIVVLYYVTDADGPTVLTNQRFPECKEKPIKFEVTELIEPKAGRVIIFDGAIWHTSILPKHKLRCIINIHVQKYRIL